MNIGEALKSQLETENLTVYAESVPADGLYPNVTYKILDEKQWRTDSGEVLMHRVHVLFAVQARSYTECLSTVAAVGAALQLQNISFTPEHDKVDPGIIRMSVDCYLFL